MKDQGRPHGFEASAAKLYASEMVEKVASDAVQIHGGYGYMEEYPVSRYYKSVKLLQIVAAILILAITGTVRVFKD